MKIQTSEDGSSIAKKVVREYFRKDDLSDEEKEAFISKIEDILRK